eukprot:3238114-Alexandrium_andersonii.AAC.1
MAIIWLGGIMVAGPEEVAIASFEMAVANHFLAKDAGKLRLGQTVRFYRPLPHARRRAHHRGASQ